MSPVVRIRRQVFYRFNVAAQFVRLQLSLAISLDCLTTNSKVPGREATGHPRPLKALASDARTEFNNAEVTLWRGRLFESGRPARKEISILSPSAIYRDRTPKIPTTALFLLRLDLSYDFELPLFRPICQSCCVPE